MPQTPADLLAHHAIVYEQRDGGASWSFRRGTSETTVAVSGRLRVSAGEGIREGVLAGLGFAIGSEWLFTPELKSGAVISVLEDWSLPAVDLWAVFPTGRQASAKARAFASFLLRAKCRLPDLAPLGRNDNSSYIEERQQSVPPISAPVSGIYFAAAPFCMVQIETAEDGFRPRFV